MKDRPATTISALIGHELQRWLTNNNLTASDAARALHVSPSRISRLLHGRRGINTNDIAGLAALCRIPPHTRDTTTAWATNTGTLTWVKHYRHHLPEPDPITHLNEHTATHITTHNPHHIPDLLHTPAYTHAHLTRSPLTPPTNLDQRLTNRIARQAVLERTNAQFTFLLHENALHHPTTGLPTDVLNDQIHHLLRLSDRPNITLHLIPTTTPAHTTTSFTRYQFTDRHPTVCLTHPTTITILDGDTNIAAYHHLIHTTTTTTLTPTDTRTRLTELAATRSSPTTRKHPGPACVRPPSTAARPGRTTSA